jgi:hypothetical protein
MKKYVLFGLLSVLLPQHLHAVKYEKNGITIEVNALKADEYAIDAQGWSLTAAQLSKKGFKAFGVTIANNGSQMITALPYISGDNNVAPTDVALLFQYRQKTRAFAQVLLGLFTCYAAIKCMMVEKLAHGFMLSMAVRAKVPNVKVGSDESVKMKMRPMQRHRILEIFKVWKTAMPAMALNIGQIPDAFRVWKKYHTVSSISVWMFRTGLAVMAIAPVTWLYYRATNKRCERACQTLGLATDYGIMPGESIEKVVVVKADQQGTFGCELFEVGAEDPFATFTAVLADVSEVVEAEKEIVSESLS